jgi:hypothetical protein
MANNPLSLFGGVAIIFGIMIFYWAYRMFWKGRLPPLTRKAELEELLIKEAILGEHGKKPNEKKRKKRWFFSWIPDEFDSEELKE